MDRGKRASCSRTRPIFSLVCLTSGFRMIMTDGLGADLHKSACSLSLRMTSDAGSVDMNSLQVRIKFCCQREASQIDGTPALNCSGIDTPRYNDICWQQPTSKTPILSKKPYTP
jgi:hypothetical protein